MPYTQKAHNFFELCKTSPEKAKKKCPSKADSKKMASEGIKKSSKSK